MQELLKLTLTQQNLERLIEMQKVKHIPAKYMSDLEEHIQNFIIKHNAEIKNMSITFNSLTNTYHAVIIY